MRNPALVIPHYATSNDDLQVLKAMLTSLRLHEPEVRTVIVDDCSPEPEIRRNLAAISQRFQAELIRQDENGGFSRTVNAGIRLVMSDGMDVILANADLEFQAPFVQTMSEQEADVVGALLIYPGVGLIQHAGQYFSLLTRTFGHLFQYGPEDLPEAQHAAERPVTHALALIRHEALSGVGLFDEEFRMGHEDVDFNVRVMREGGRCVYQPAVKAWHHESVFRSRPSEKLQRWQQESWAHFRSKWATENVGAWVPLI